jgi:ketosteroid isomerase-like protein
MSQENIEIIRRGYEQFAATGELDRETISPDLVWDMSNFAGWPEQQIYEGIEGAQAFLENWRSAWDDWVLEVDGIRDAGDKVVVLARQHGRSKAAGMPVEMTFAQVWTLRAGKQVRMDMYSDREAALEAVGLTA